MCHIFGFLLSSYIFSHSIWRLMLFSWIAKFNTKYTPYAKYYATPNQSQLLSVFHRFYHTMESILSSCIENQSEKGTFTNRHHNESFRWYIVRRSVLYVFLFVCTSFLNEQNELKTKVEEKQEKEDQEFVIFRCFIICLVDDT